MEGASWADMRVVNEGLVTMGDTMEGAVTSACPFTTITVQHQCRPVERVMEQYRLLRERLFHEVSGWPGVEVEPIEDLIT